MNNVYVDKEAADKWTKISHNLAQASKLLDEAELILMLELNVTTGRPAETIRNIQEAINGQAYMFFPQGEWMGGETWKTRLPHIAK